MSEGPRKTTEPPLPPLLEWDALERAAECLRILAHPVRLRMVQILLHGKYSVGELAAACGTESNVASEHLRLMERCGLLSRDREGRRSFYRVAEPHLAGIMDCVRTRFGEPAGPNIE